MEINCARNCGSRIKITADKQGGALQDFCLRRNNGINWVLQVNRLH
jgi:hypothetical protein